MRERECSSLKQRREKSEKGKANDSQVLEKRNEREETRNESES